MPRMLLLGLAILLGLVTLYAGAILAVDAAIPPARLHARIGQFVAAGQIERNYIIGGLGREIDLFSDCIALSLNAFGPPGRTALDLARDDDVMLTLDRPGVVEGPCTAIARMPPAGDPAIRWQVYGRYWHGYQVITKPLLQVIGLPHARALMDGLCILAVFGCFAVATRRRVDGLAAAACFVVLTGAADPDNALVHSLALAVCFAGGVPVWAAARRGLAAAFLTGVVAASLAAFVDLIYVPPLSAMVLVFAAREAEARPMLVFATMLLAWAMGYLGTMALKVPVWMLLAGDPWAPLRDFTAALLLRLDGDIPAVLPRPGFLVATRMNLHALADTRFLPWVALGVGLIVLARVLRGWRFGWSAALPPILAAAALPLPWYEVFRNHSEIHYWFMYRAAALSASLLVVALLAALRPARRDPAYVS